MTRETPWLTEKSIEYIEKFLKEKSESYIFEFGSGSSTEWLRQRCRHLTSVEHDPKYIKPGIILSKRPYHKQIELFPDNYFSMVLVDGRDRNLCIESSIPKIISSGILVLDNSERNYYDKGKKLLSSWEQFHFVQTSPDRYGFTYNGWTTSIYIKNGENK